MYHNLFEFGFFFSSKILSEVNLKKDITKFTTYKTHTVINNLILKRM